MLLSIFSFVSYSWKFDYLKKMNELVELSLRRDDVLCIQGGRCFAAVFLEVLVMRNFFVRIQKHKKSARKNNKFGKTGKVCVKIWFDNFGYSWEICYPSLGEIFYPSSGEILAWVSLVLIEGGFFYEGGQTQNEKSMTVLHIIRLTLHNSDTCENFEPLS